jgi:ATP-dependent DNA ligase
VNFDHLQSGRFRHAARFLRWRPDKPASACTYDQLDTAVPAELMRIFEDAGGKD